MNFLHVCSEFCNHLTPLERATLRHRVEFIDQSGHPSWWDEAEEENEHPILNFDDER